MIVDYKKIKKIKNTKFTDNTTNRYNVDGYFGEFVNNNIITPPPNNLSLQTKLELETLSGLPQDKEFVERHDNIRQVFYDLCLRFKLSFPNDEISFLINESSEVILYYKYMFNRPRPKQLAELYDINLGEIVELGSMNTPSYPSGHSVQGILISMFLSNMYPKYKSKFIRVGRNISSSRQIARAHYPSDSIEGMRIGKLLYKEYIKNQNDNRNK